MEKDSNKEKVYKALEEALKKDRARPSIMKISQLGLVEMTRKRTRDSLVRSMCEPCSYCEGRGFIKNKQTISYDIMRDIEREGMEIDTNAVSIQCHPSVADELLEDKRDIIENLEHQFNKKITIRGNGAYHHEQYELIAHRTEKNITWTSQERKTLVKTRIQEYLQAQKKQRQQEKLSVVTQSAPAAVAENVEKTGLGDNDQLQQSGELLQGAVDESLAVNPAPYGVEGDATMGGASDIEGAETAVGSVPTDSRPQGQPRQGRFDRGRGGTGGGRRDHHKRNNPRRAGGHGRDANRNAAGNEVTGGRGQGRRHHHAAGNPNQRPRFQAPRPNINQPSGGSQVTAPGYENLQDDNIGNQNREPNYNVQHDIEDPLDNIGNSIHQQPTSGYVDENDKRRAGFANNRRHQNNRRPRREGGHVGGHVGGSTGGGHSQHRRPRHHHGGAGRRRPSNFRGQPGNAGGPMAGPAMNQDDFNRDREPRFKVGGGPATDSGAGTAPAAVVVKPSSQTSGGGDQGGNQGGNE